MSANKPSRAARIAAQQQADAKLFAPVTRTERYMLAQMRRLWAAVLSEQPAPSAEPVALDDLADTVSKAMRRAYNLGQTYWQQADSESYRQNAKAGETQSKFDALVDETRGAVLSSPQPDSWREQEMEAEIDKLGDDVIQLRASRDSLLVERNSLARRVAELEAEVERLRNAMKLARRELLECQHNVGKGHVCFDGDDFHEALSAVEAALAAKVEQS